MRKPCRGVTLTEIMVAFVLFTLIAFSLYFVMGDTARKRNLVQARNEAAAEAARLLTALHLDVSQALAGTLHIQGQNETFALGMLLPPLPESNTRRLIEYRRQGTTLFRRENGRDHVLARHVADLSLDQVASADNKPVPGQYRILVKTSMPMDGSPVPQTHEQAEIITNRGEAEAAKDPFWVPAGDLSAVQGFDTVLQNIVKDLESTGQGIGNIVVTSYEQAKTAFDGILESINGMRDTIKNLDQTIVNNVTRLGEGIGGFPDAARLAQAVLGIQKWSHLIPGQTFEQFCASIGVDVNKLKGEARNLYEGKKRALEAGRQMLEQMKAINVQAEKEGFPTMPIDPALEAIFS